LGIKPTKPILIILIIVLVLATLGLIAYQHFYAPKQALASYFKKLSSTKTASISGQLSLTSEAPTITTETNFNGGIDLSDNANPKWKLEYSGSLNLEDIASNLRGNAVFSGRSLYLRIDEFDKASELGLEVSPNQWYKLQSGSTASGCSKEDYVKAQQFIQSELLPSLALVNPRRIGWLPETIEGIRAAHYRGEIDSEELRGQFKALNSQMSEDCRSQNFDNTFIDFADATITYDVWRGKELDRLKVNIKNPTNSELNLVLTTSDYSNPQMVVEPASDSSLQELLDNLFKSILGQAVDDSETEEEPAAEEPAIETLPNPGDEEAVTQ